MPSILLPLEIEETILDVLSEDDEGHSTLKMCSLVCHAFLPICRKHIFRNIVLNDIVTCYERSPPIIHAFARLLRKTPEIADYIRKLDYNIRITELTTTSSQSIQESLKRISRLEFLTILTWRYEIDWSNNPIRPALLHLLHLPTLTHFSVHANNFVVSDLIPCVNLKYLEIGFYSTVAAKITFPEPLPELPVQLNRFEAGIRDPSRSAIMMLWTARRPDGQPIIDFESLPEIKVDILDGRASQELFRCCHLLTNAHIFCMWYPLS